MPYPAVAAPNILPPAHVGIGQKSALQSANPLLRIIPIETLRDSTANLAIKTPTLKEPSALSLNGSPYSSGASAPNADVCFFRTDIEGYIEGDNESKILSDKERKEMWNDNSWQHYLKNEPLDNPSEGKQIPAPFTYLEVEASTLDDNREVKIAHLSSPALTKKTGIKTEQETIKETRFSATSFAAETMDSDVPGSNSDETSAHQSGFFARLKKLFTSTDSLNAQRQLFKATHNATQEIGSNGEPTATNMSNATGSGAFSVAGLEAASGLAAAILQYRRAEKEYNEAKQVLKDLKSLSDKEKKINVAYQNALHKKESAGSDKKLNLAIMLRYGLTGQLHALRLAYFSGNLAGSTAGTALLTTIGILAPPLALFAAGITLYALHREARSINSSKKINQTTQFMQTALTWKKKESKAENTKIIENTEIKKAEEDLAAILTCIQSKQASGLKWFSLSANSISLSGYLTIAAGGLTLLLGSTAIVLTAGVALAALAGAAGFGILTYRYLNHRAHQKAKAELITEHELLVKINRLKQLNAASLSDKRINKIATLEARLKTLETLSDREKRERELALLSISGASAVNRLLTLTKHKNEAISNAAKSILSQAVPMELLNQLKLDDPESFKQVTHKFNINAKIKHQAQMITSTAEQPSDVEAQQAEYPLRRSVSTQSLPANVQITWV